MKIFRPPKKRKLPENKRIARRPIARLEKPIVQRGAVRRVEHSAVVLGIVAKLETRHRDYEIVLLCRGRRDELQMADVQRDGEQRKARHRPARVAHFGVDFDLQRLLLLIAEPRALLLATVSKIARLFESAPQKGATAATIVDGVKNCRREFCCRLLPPLNRRLAEYCQSCCALALSASDARRQTKKNQLFLVRSLVNGGRAD